MEYIEEIRRSLEIMKRAQFTEETVEGNSYIVPEPLVFHWSNDEI